MEIKINKTALDMDKKELKGMLSFTISLEETLETSYDSSVNHAKSKILNEIVDLAVKKYGEIYADKVIKEIDMDAIIKRVQLNIVSNVASGRC